MVFGKINTRSELLLNNPHRRYNPLTDDWVLVSPQRSQRPWQGKVESTYETERAKYDPDCYLCPGNKRAGGNVNENYEDTYVFTNDFPALLHDNQSHNNVSTSSLIKSELVKGTNRVICFSPHHDLTLAEMGVENILKVIKTWVDQQIELSKTYKWVQIFENKGELMGCSNPHPHGQIWAIDSLPNIAEKENETQLRYYKYHDRSLLLDYINQEIKLKDRIVLENEDWVLLVPYWAFWPFETLLITKSPKSTIAGLNENEQKSLADILKKILVKYDNLFETSFPYSMGWHSAPSSEIDKEYWQLHAHFYPPLLRSAAVKKFMVGYELLSEVQRDITAEMAAEMLREQLVFHYRENKA